MLHGLGQTAPVGDPDAQLGKWALTTGPDLVAFFFFLICSQGFGIEDVYWKRIDHAKSSTVNIYELKGVSSNYIRDEQALHLLPFATTEA